MSIFQLIILLIHISASAVLFAYPMGLVSAVRRALDAGDDPYRQAASDAVRRSKITGMFAIITLLSGVGMIFAKGGFAAVPSNIHFAMLALMVAIGFSALWMRPNTQKLAEAAGESINRELAEASLKKLGMGSGILSAIWMIILLLMFTHQI